MTYAHSQSGSPISEWQPLQDHCKAVADMAATFADPFASNVHGRLLGWLHDLSEMLVGTKIEGD